MISPSAPSSLRVLVSRGLSGALIALAALPSSSGCSSHAASSAGPDDAAVHADSAGSRDATSDARRTPDAAASRDGSADVESARPDASLAFPGDAGGSSGLCPSVGIGSIETGTATCFAVTPTFTGANPAGENADKASYALSPAASPNGKLVLFLNGTGAHPSDSIGMSKSMNFYNAAVQLGYQVLAVSYRSDETIAKQCVCADACYFPSRETVIRGVLESGASSDLDDILLDEGITGRTVLALRWLVKNDATHPWSTYLTSASPNAAPETQIDWSKIVVAGHSQGGGHAAAIGKLFPVARVVQLSSSCDAVFAPTMCSHSTNIEDATIASWLQRSNGTWETPASSYWGLDIKTVYTPDGSTWVSGDGACFLHAAIWQSIGMSADHENDADAICGATTITENHDASIDCPANFAAWQTMLQ